MTNAKFTPIQQEALNECVNLYMQIEGFTLEEFLRSLQDLSIQAADHRFQGLLSPIENNQSTGVIIS